MSSERIPAEAFKGVEDPKEELFKKCFNCGGGNVRTLSMAQMMSVPRDRIVNANTFMIPGKAWGYLQCDDCEDKRASEKS